LTEAHSNISQTLQSLCFVNNYSASTYKNSLTAWTLDSRESMSWWVGGEYATRELIALWH